MKHTTAWLIVAKTNLHVGNENTSSYGIIDKEIQRDALTGLPCINSGSLKGALNEYATEMTDLTKEQRLNIFGVDKKDTKTQTQKGNSIFFDAQILCLPRQDNETLYKLVTSEEVIRQFIDKGKLFGVTIDLDTLKNALGDYTLISNKKFVESCNDENLPIVARNKLDNGESANLWYEQYLPQETVLCTFISSEDDSLEKAIDRNIIQIGANATIGYGYCKFIKLSKSNDHEQTKE